MNIWTTEQMNKWTNKHMNKWTNEQMNKWTNEQMNKWTNEQMYKWKFKINLIAKLLIRAILLTDLNINYIGSSAGLENHCYVFALIVIWCLVFAWSAGV